MEAVEAKLDRAFKLNKFSNGLSKEEDTSSDEAGVPVKKIKLENGGGMCSAKFAQATMQYTTE